CLRYADPAAPDHDTMSDALDHRAPHLGGEHMAQVLDLPFPIMRYDITMPLLEGRVEIEGVRLQPTRITSMVFKDEPALRTGDFGLCDLNLGYLLPAIEAGWELVALPVFSKRNPA